MRPWYRNSTLQMDDAEMEWLQSKDAASCAVWEWLKADSQKRDGDPKVRDLSEYEVETIARRLGIDAPRFSQISQRLRDLKWIINGEIRGWSKWQSSRTAEEDAARKKADYWKRKALNVNSDTINIPISPTVSQNLHAPPLEQRRGEEIRGEVQSTPIPPSETELKLAVDQSLRPPAELSPLGKKVSKSELKLGLEVKKPLTDEEWIESLQRSKAYEGIDIPTQFARMQQWCALHRKQPNHRRFLNWLNKCERPMSAGATGPSKEGAF